MNFSSLLLKLSKRFPKSLAYKHHDHVGLMTGKKPQEVKKILLCLDLDLEVLPHVRKYKPDVIFTHHPFIYGTKKEVFKWDKKREALCQMVDELNIPVYSYHTNFDEGKGGMNDALAAALCLKNIHQGEKEPMMRFGELDKAMDVIEFSKYAKEKLGVDYGLLIHTGKKKVKKVAIIGGGGGGYAHIAQEEGADIYISGDAPHHVRRDIYTSKFNYLDLPHEIEKIFMPTMKNILLDIDSTLDILIIDHEKLPTVI